MIHNYKYTQNAFLPKTVVIPLIQEKNKLCKPVIKIGATVEEGQIIASSKTSSNFLSLASNKYQESAPGIVLISFT